MAIKNNHRNKVFNSFLLKNAHFVGKDEFPIIKKEISVPNKLITFSEALNTKDYNQWVCFYEDDYKFIRLWNNPKKYLIKLKKFNGVISPDFSMYWDMPNILQKYNCFIGRSLASWFIENGIKVIPNIRYGDERSKDYFTLGIEPYGNIAIGTLGCIKNNLKRKMLIEGLQLAVTLLKPKNIIVYGSAPKTIFQKYKNQNINVIVYEDKTSKYFKNIN